MTSFRWMARMLSFATDGVIDDWLSDFNRMLGARQFAAVWQDRHC